MLVEATELGHDGTRLRYPGDQFEMSKGARANWFKPVTAKPDKAPEQSPEDKPQDKD